MKKLIHKGSLLDVQRVPSSQGQIVAYKSNGKVYIQHLELMPKDACRIEKTDDGLAIRVQLQDGDVLVIQDADGVAEKYEIN